MTRITGMSIYKSVNNVSPEGQTATVAHVRVLLLHPNSWIETL